MPGERAAGTRSAALRGKLCGSFRAQRREDAGQPLFPGVSGVAVVPRRSDRGTTATFPSATETTNVP